MSKAIICLSLSLCVCVCVSLSLSLSYLVCGQLEELVKVNTPVGVLLECTTLLRCGHG